MVGKAAGSDRVAVKTLTAGYETVRLRCSHTCSILNYFYAAYLLQHSRGLRLLELIYLGPTGTGYSSAVARILSLCAELPGT